MAEKPQDSNKTEKTHFQTNHSINTFFKRVVESTGFTWDPTLISEAIYKHYKFEIESGVIRKQDRISEIAENALLGTFDIKPLSLQAIKEAIGKLSTSLKDVEKEWNPYTTTSKRHTTKQAT
ncbi:MAG: hypothetical protein QXQ94_05795 [Candidatus Bathyarchaeia archaeon]